MSPWLRKKSIFNQYDPAKGFVVESTEKNIANLRANADLKNADDIEGSYYSPAKNMHLLWLVDSKEDRNDRRNYRLVTLDDAGHAIKIFEYFNQTSKKPITSNKPVYDKSGKIVGLVSVFGYDNQSNKKYLDPEKKDLNSFEVLYFDLSGNLKWKSVFNHGDEKNYKM